MVEHGAERVDRSTRARQRWSSPVSKLCKLSISAVETVMFGAEDEVEMSIWLDRTECAAVHFSRARARRAREFLGAGTRAWERAIVRHLSV